jgi:P-type Cu+ transporter
MDLDNGRVVFGDPVTETHGKVTDPVCGMEIERADAEAALEFQGTLYYFCSAACKERFAAKPDGYVSASASP